ncbi:MAG: hypothetical protein COA67_04200 [Lutibacter sp.]|nr:MAG: hypothetical protein COA67_04200 [Lutibacter sp.]
MVINWSELARGEGWGLLLYVGLLIIGIFGLIIDHILKSIFKNKLYLNLFELLFIVLILFSTRIQFSPLLVFFTNETT